ncbi:MAG: triose-phosphate isomerase [Spirochaetes bacterium]|nr:triose-phosphate isomerase [Spirochaetota bacterium]
MSRRRIFAGNWKMYTTHGEAMALVEGILSGISGVKDREVIVFPPSPWAKAVADRCAKTAIAVGMQNMYYENEGAFTGEVSPAMVKDAGCRYALIGHSERRHVFGEKDGEVNRKVKAALAHGLEPVLCVGELLDEREKNLTDEVLARQVNGALEGVDAAGMKKVIVAYEPVWAIGTGKVATPEIADRAHRVIRRLIEERYGKEIAASLPILYGGSVKPDNIAGLYAKEEIDGVLVGGASLKADSFLEIIRVK